jgi:hypothetical protein
MSEAAAICAPGGRAAEVEDGRNLALLLAVPHEPAVAAAAKGQREGVEEDRLAGSGLAGEHAQAVLKCSSSLSIRTMSRIASWTSMRGLEAMRTAGSLPATDRGAYPAPAALSYDGGRSKPSRGDEPPRPNP